MRNVQSKSNGTEDEDARAKQVREAVRLIEAGNRFEDEGRPGDALHSYDEAVKVAPDLLRAHLNRGNALLAMGNIEGALAAYAGGLQRDPNNAPSHFNMGNAYLRADRLDAAETAYRKAVACDPEFAAAETALGSVLWRRGRREDAVASYRRALNIDAGNVSALCNLGHAQMDLGQLDGAVSSFRRALALDPQLGEAWNDMALVLRRQGHLEEAKTSLLRALAISSDFPEAQTHLGIVQLELGQIRESIETQLNILQHHPDFAEAHSNLGNVYRHIGEGDKAMTSYRRAAELRPGSVEGHHNLATALQEAGRLAEAAQSFRRAIAINSNFAEAHTGLLFCLSHDASVAPADLYVAHTEFGERQEAPLRQDWPAHANARDPDRMLRIGFVSADLRSHPVTNFLEPLLKYLRESPKLAIYAYYNHPIEDEVTRRLRRQFAYWRATSHLSDEQLARQIRDDGIDILVDLSGHTGGHRLLTFARKPAPIQVSWIGYPGTTGLTAIDYYIADRHYLPMDEFSRQFSEKLVHLPAVAPFLPEAVAPPVNALPALRNGYITFGSFNRLSKLSPSVIGLWSQLLRLVPESRMLLGAMPDERQCAGVLGWFAKEGVGPERLQLHPRCDMTSYLALHHRVDMCLDTFPYSGATTTANALWMGVPTLTLVGHTPAGRQGIALLGQLGLGQFVATSRSEFVDRGSLLIADLETLAQVRAGLRARCEMAPSWHPDLIAVGLEAAFRIMWQRWCSRLPPTSFETFPQSP